MKCEIKGCGNEVGTAYLTYEGKWICHDCWEQLQEKREG